MTAKSFNLGDALCVLNSLRAAETMLARLPEALTDAPALHSAAMQSALKGRIAVSVASLHDLTLEIVEILSVHGCDADHSHVIGQIDLDRPNGIAVAPERFDSRAEAEQAIATFNFQHRLTRTYRFPMPAAFAVPASTPSPSSRRWRPPTRATRS